MHSLVEELSLLLVSKSMILATAESCTGGLISAAITDRAGSSAVFDRGFITYTNQSKMDLLGVSPNTLAQHGAVSEETAKEMAIGALKHSHAQISVAVTGIAGPTGGTPQKPVGLVYIAIADKSGADATKNIFEGNRTAIRQATVEKALELLIERLSSKIA
jgi:PncC family amidohydrolase